MVRFHAFGATHLVGRDGAEARSVLSRPKRLGLFAFLALAHPRGFHRRDELTALFWPELDHAHARGALRQSLHHYRRVLGADVVHARGDEEVAIDAARLWCDALELERLADAGRLAEALELYRGPLLPAFHLSGCAEVERWLEAERDRLARRAAAIASALAQSRHSAGDAPGAIDAARRTLDLAPYDESAARTLIWLLAHGGARAEAIETYDSFARRLRADMDVDPSDETQAAVSAIRAPAPSVSSRAKRGIPAPWFVQGPAGPSPDDAAEIPRFARDDSLVVARDDRKPGSRRWLRAIPLAGLVLAAAAYAGTRLGDAEALETARRRVAVMPFTVAGDDGLAYLREGIAELLGAHLDGAGELRAIDANVVLANLPSDGVEIDPDRGRALAARFGAGLYVLGDVIEAGGRLRATASLYDGRGALLGRAQATASDESGLFELVADLARQLVALAPVEPRDRIARVAAVTTTSFSAFKAYLAAESLLRAGHYDSAVASYDRAIAYDSTFALAYYRMAIARHRDPTPTGLADAHRRALALAERLPERERLLVQAFDAFERHDEREAERLYREVLSLYPDEVDAWVLLGEVIIFYELWRGRPTGDARHALERALALDSSHFGALMQMNWLAAIEERFDEVGRIAERMLAQQPHGHFGPAARLQLALVRHDTAAEARAMADVRARESGYINWAQRFAHFSGNLAGAARAARVLTEPSHPDDFRRLGHVLASRHLLDRGRWADAFAELAPVERVAPDAYLWTWSRHHLRPFAPVAGADLERVAARVEAWSPTSPEHRLGRLHTLGVIAARLGDSRAAESWADTLDSSAAAIESTADGPHDATLARALALGVRAWGAAEEGRASEALALLDRVHADEWMRRGESGGLEVDAVQSWLRAEMLMRLGRDREAMHVLAPLGFLWGDAGLLAPKHLRLGEIHERLGDRARAVHHYRRFIEVLRDCDPGLRPLVRDVEARVERLAG